MWRTEINGAIDTVVIKRGLMVTDRYWFRARCGLKEVRAREKKNIPPRLS